MATRFMVVGQMNGKGWSALNARNGKCGFKEKLLSD